LACGGTILHGKRHRACAKVCLHNFCNSASGAEEIADFLIRQVRETQSFPEGCHKDICERVADRRGTEIRQDLDQAKKRNKPVE
jgi:hypothetical protein